MLEAIDAMPPGEFLAVVIAMAWAASLLPR